MHFWTGNAVVDPGGLSDDICAATRVHFLELTVAVMFTGVYHFIRADVESNSEFQRHSAAAWGLIHTRTCR